MSVALLTEAQIEEIVSRSVRQAVSVALDSVGYSHEDKMLDIYEAAKVLGLDVVNMKQGALRTKMWRLSNDTENPLTHHKIGQKCMYKMSDLKEFINNHKL